MFRCSSHSPRFAAHWCMLQLDSNKNTTCMGSKKLRGGDFVGMGTNEEERTVVVTECKQERERERKNSIVLWRTIGKEHLLFFGDYAEENFFSEARTEVEMEIQEKQSPQESWNWNYCTFSFHPFHIGFDVSWWMGAIVCGVTWEVTPALHAMLEICINKAATQQ